MKGERANKSLRIFHYNTRSCSRHESVERASAASLRVTKRRKKTSDDRCTNADLLPMDLIMEILQRLPVKTLARFLCVSNLWASIIRRRDFMKLFLAESSDRHVFTFMRGEDSFIFSSPQTLTPVSIATYHVTPPTYESQITCSSLHGLICYGTAHTSRLVVYSSTTRRSITLPELDPGSYFMQPFLGYDPIDGVYKVVCMTGTNLVHGLTLGNENSWRMIENSHSHVPDTHQICINGVVYYEASTDSGTQYKKSVFMSFDVRSEKFHLIKGPGGGTNHHLLGSIFSALIRYEGKLAMTSSKISANGSMVLWVLEDEVKHKWLKKVFVLPNSWTSLAPPRSTSSPQRFRFLNVTDVGELILAPVWLRDSPYYVLCYDPKRNSVRKVVIEGIAGHKLLRYKKQETCVFLHLFSSQVENLMFL